MPVNILTGLNAALAEVAVAVGKAAAKFVSSFLLSRQACQYGRRNRQMAPNPMTVPIILFGAIPNCQTTNTPTREMNTQENSVTRMEMYQNRLVGARKITSR